MNNNDDINNHSKKTTLATLRTSFKATKDINSFYFLTRRERLFGKNPNSGNNKMINVCFAQVEWQDSIAASIAAAVAFE